MYIFNFNSCNISARVGGVLFAGGCSDCFVIFAGGCGCDGTAAGDAPAA